MTGVAQATPVATALLQAARRLDEEARRHKRAEHFHRRQAQAARRDLAEVEAACRDLGIRFVTHHGHSPEEDTDR